MLAVLGVSFASSARAWLQQRSDINTLTAQIAASKAHIGSLEQEKRRWHDQAYIRTQARERFGWLMPGETGYRVIDEHGHILPSGSSLSELSAGAPHNAGEWWQRAWDSVVAAGADSRKVHHRPRPTPLTSIGKVPHFEAPQHINTDDWQLPQTPRGPAGR